MTATAAVPSALAEAGRRAGDALRATGATVAVAEGSCGGLVSAALLAVPGASAYYLGGSVIYTPTATRAFLKGAIDAPPDMRGATETFVRYLAESVAVKLGADWGIGEGGATGPKGNPYGDPPGHCWVAVHGRSDSDAARHVLTGLDDREANMVAFATAALDLLTETIEVST